MKPTKPMKHTPLSLLVGLGVFFALAFAIVTHRFYGDFPPVPLSVAVTVWGLTAMCAVMTWVVRRALGNGTIGIDRSQLNPITVANWMVIGKASAITGAILGGVYIGIGSYVVPRAGVLVAAADDLPAVILCALGGVGLAISGVVLERSCSVPPGEPG